MLLSGINRKFVVNVLQWLWDCLALDVKAFPYPYCCEHIANVVGLLHRQKQVHDCYIIVVNL